MTSKQRLNEWLDKSAKVLDECTAHPLTEVGKQGNEAMAWRCWACDKIQVSEDNLAGWCDDCRAKLTDEDYKPPEPRKVDTNRPHGPAWGPAYGMAMAIASMERKARRLFPSAGQILWHEGRLKIQGPDGLVDIHDEVANTEEAA